jgi:hypothetical protein
VTKFTRALADGTFRTQVVAETRAWFDAHPVEAQGVMELFAPQARRRELASKRKSRNG